MQQSDVKLPDFHFMGTAQWSWAETWYAADADAGLIFSSTMLSKVLWSEQRTYSRHKELSTAVFEGILLIGLKHTLFSVQATARSVQ